MAELSILAGATSQSIIVKLLTTGGAAQTGLVYNSLGLTCYYSFTGANATSVAVTLATLAAVNSAWSSGGFKEIDATNMPGCYRFDIPNAVLAASKGQQVVIVFNGFLNMAPDFEEIELTGWNNQLTPGAAGGMFIAGTNAATAINGTAASGATPAVAALTLTGGAASTTGGGVASSGLKITGGAGAASTNGAVAGATFAGGGTNTVASTASGIISTGTSDGHGLECQSGTGSNAALGCGIYAASNSSGQRTAGIYATGNSNVNSSGIIGIGGNATSSNLIQGSGMALCGVPAGLGTSGGANTYPGAQFTGITTGAGARFSGGTSGNGITVVAGSSTGDGINISTTSGHGITSTGSGTAKDGIRATGSAAATTNAAGNGINAIGGAASTGAGGTAGFGLKVIGGAGATSTNGAASGASMAGGGTNTVSSVADGLLLTGTSNGSGLDCILAGTGASITAATITGTLSTLTTYTGNTPQTGDAFLIVKSGGTGDNAAIKAKTDNLPASPASTTNITAGTITTVTNLTNAPTSGDFTTTMKTSLNASTPASITGAVGSVTARVTANTDQWAGGTIPAPNVTGVPLVDDKYLLGTIYSTPATAGIQDINVKNMNNIAATAITTIKAVQGLTTADTITTYTGNTPQTGDSFARIGTAGVGLTNLGDTRIANLDATISSRMATYTQPSGFLATTFPSGTIANTTNITAGTITTATNLTTNNDKTGYALTASYDFAKGTVAMTESYAAVTAAMTPVQAFYQLVQQAGQASISGTLETVKKRDQSTTAKTFTINDAINPTAITETT